MSFKNILLNLPEVRGPTQKRLPFNEKLKWTIVCLVLFFVLGMIPLFGLGQNALLQFEYLSLILGASFGSIISLGIGPIVTASIVLQLLNGAGILKFDLTTQDGKKFFQGTQKMLAFFFIVFEAGIYVFMGGLAPTAVGDVLANGIVMTAPLFFEFQLILIFQLFLGGLIIMFMDEIVSKWGFGSGISLFIVAGVSQQIFIRSFSWIKPEGVTYSTGKVIQLFQALMASDPTTAMLAAAAILSTVIVFAIAVYAQAMKVEIPLSFGRIRGYGIRWPLHFIYTSVIPVILVSALFANFQLWASLLAKSGRPWLGSYDSSGAASGFVSYIQPPNLVEMIVQNGGLGIGFDPYIRALVYILLMIGGSVLFAYFWVQTAGMDAKSQAKNIMKSGLQIPGFRKDERILEHLLDRYIGPLTIMGATTIGFLAAIADLSGALSQGTGILLSVMIVYKLYEEIAQKHMMDMYPGLRKMME
jgi:preprotein translocase subunit SecY